MIINVVLDYYFIIKINLILEFKLFLSEDIKLLYLFIV